MQHWRSQDLPRGGGGGAKPGSEGTKREVLGGDCPPPTVGKCLKIHVSFLHIKLNVILLGVGYCVVAQTNPLSPFLLLFSLF